MILLLNAFPTFAQQPDSASVVYHRPLFDFDPKKPPFKLAAEQLSNRNRLLRFSVLTGYREGVEPVSGFANFSSHGDKETGTRRLYMFNLSIQDMLTFGHYQSNRVILEVKNPSLYRYDPSQGPEYEWLRKNGHCFELLLPEGTIKGADVLIKELARVFRVEFSLKKRMVNALVLVRTSNKDKIKSTEKGEGYYNMRGYFNNVPINRLLDPLNKAGLPPALDETGYKDPVDLDLHLASWTDLTVLRRELQRYDLDIKEEKREVEMFVIKEIN